MQLLVLGGMEEELEDILENMGVEEEKIVVILNEKLLHCYERAVIQRLVILCFIRPSL